ncbi:hypothetical protein H5410_033639 [Solanum commersonii]|uniref:Uncharacterized protein n=1 Tax=Solanum commersonii TaxID=4109 RepID=A0A9J5YQT2_SOLCO|nr:hypothetical protein H5410_033639 [Solanum commersonii]
MSSFSNSSMASVDEGRYCRCGNEALLKTSWTQLNPGPLRDLNSSSISKSFSSGITSTSVSLLGIYDSASF